MELKNNEMERIYAETFRQIREGTILAGRVVSVKQDGVIVDIGYKSEGFISADEFAPEELANLKDGDVLDVYVVNIQDSEGIVTLSKDKASRIRAWDVLESAFEKGTTIEGTIVGKTKGGLTVDVLGVKAFLPGSQIDTKAVRDLDALMGKTLAVKILKLNNKRSNIIVSRRAAVEEERQKKKLDTVPKLLEGAHLEGVVKNITDYGVFVDLGGIDGLLHISDISWGRISHPSEFFAIGDTIEVIVLKYDGEHERVTLGYKQKMADPWLAVEEKYPVGKSVGGRVVSLADYGAFIELEPGIEGLVHVSEIDWSPRPKHPS
ncbi:MAG TPA: S1 RNA-binding domain-containing protein, partial [Thermodesulfovibrionales bacterium]|nr:S1 RNA-binding domain-containing protein [Thermodesulfovibrionales bacterium]